MNNYICVIFTIDTENLPENFQELIQQEQAAIAQWKKEGFIEHFFVRQTRNGAVGILKDIDEVKAKELVQQLPLYQYSKSIEYLPLVKQF